MKTIVDNINQLLKNAIITVFCCQLLSGGVRAESDDSESAAFQELQKSLLKTPKLTSEEAQKQYEAIVKPVVEKNAIEAAEAGAKAAAEAAPKEGGRDKNTADTKAANPYAPAKKEEVIVDGSGVEKSLSFGETKVNAKKSPKPHAQIESQDFSAPSVEPSGGSEMSFTKTK